MNVSEGKKQSDMGTDWLLLMHSLCTTRNVTYHPVLQGRIKSLATPVIDQQCILIGIQDEKQDKAFCSLEKQVPQID